MMTGYCFSLISRVISWANKKQTCIALSTMEAEFVASANTVQEGVWLKRFLHNLGVVANANESVKIYYDNQAAIAYPKAFKYHWKTKHIDVKYNYVKTWCHRMKSSYNIYLHIEWLLTHSQNLLLEMCINLILSFWDCELL